MRPQVFRAGFRFIQPHRLAKTPIRLLTDFNVASLGRRFQLGSSPSFVGISPIPRPTKISRFSPNIPISLIQRDM